jgi:hypothetical protein
LLTKGNASTSRSASTKWPVAATDECGVLFTGRSPSGQDPRLVASITGARRLRFWHVSGMAIGGFEGTPAIPGPVSVGDTGIEPVMQWLRPRRRMRIAANTSAFGSTPQSVNTRPSCLGATITPRASPSFWTALPGDEGPNSARR